MARARSAHRAGPWLVASCDAEARWPTRKQRPFEHLLPDRLSSMTGNPLPAAGGMGFRLDAGIPAIEIGPRCLPHGHGIAPLRIGSLLTAGAIWYKL